MRVVLLSDRSVLAVGVQRLLQDVDGIELSVVALHGTEMAAKVRQLAPRVIVLDPGDASRGGALITQMLEEHPRARVVALGLNQTGIEVYRMKRVAQVNLEGLLQAIRAGKGGERRRKGHSAVKQEGQLTPKSSYPKENDHVQSQE